MVNITASGMFEPGGHHSAGRPLPEEALEPSAKDRDRMERIYVSIVEQVERDQGAAPPYHEMRCAGCKRELTFYGFRPPRVQMCPQCEARCN